jgi:hypothetical protein
MPERGDYLPEMSMVAVDLLDDNKKGFFLILKVRKLTGQDMIMMETECHSK